MRIRQHVNPTLLHFEQFRGELPPAANGRAVEVEIGCADAQFLFERAALDPARSYVGLEIRQELVHLVNKRARAVGAPVHAVYCQAQLHLPIIFADASVDRVFINFPDPWFKNRHHERRMIDDRLLAGVARALRPGGELLLQTDVWELAIDGLATIERTEQFSNRAGEWSFWRGPNPYGVRSWREQNAAETGLPVWRALFARQ
ncbi:MAG: methyltransferase domain-containing protein [Kofleriaceae bacterium]|nr:methyltransferase domain-containing protein [Kofleriaceae bacterium]MBP6837188.1 methyltransferase domain-containing protein [Kofleriaceae bacterium]MBP9203693.1 methyltransferase domain-containing protein [Kofleriaceae bacterium]